MLYQYELRQLDYESGFYLHQTLNKQTVTSTTFKLGLFGALKLISYISKSYFSVVYAMLTLGPDRLS